MKAIILTIGVLLISVSCSNDDDGISGGGSTGGKCYKITYEKTATYPFVKEISRFETTMPATGGYVDNGGSTVYEVKCY